MSLRVLMVTNTPGPKGCGIANFGDLHTDALRKAGVDVTVWRADYPRYMPDNVEDFDVVHINSHPGTINHIQAQHLPKGPLNSVLFHEVPNSWWETGEFPSTWHAADVRLTEEPIPGWEGDGKTYYWQMPVPDYFPKSRPEMLELYTDVGRGPELMLSSTPRIGRTGILQDGLDRTIPACERNGWELSKSGDAGRWLTIEEEIERLAKCHLIDCHRHSSYVGQASSVLTAIASRRPILINSSRLLKTIYERDQELGKELYRIEDLEEGVRTILEDIRNGCEKRPFKLAERYSWKRQTEELLKIWRAHL